MGSSVCAMVLSRAQTNHALTSRIVLSAFKSRLETTHADRVQRPTLPVVCHRKAHSQRHVSSAAYEPPSHPHPESHPIKVVMSRPLSCLPLLTLIRSYIITSVSA